jgi:hypothetical protein
MTQLAQVFVLAFGLAMLGFGGHALLVGVRRWETGERTVLLTYAGFRLATGGAALWLALGGGGIAGWTMAFFIVAHLAWSFILSRRAPEPE